MKMYMAFTPIIAPCDCDIWEIPEREALAQHSKRPLG